ncbi:hypothetical protein HDU76_000560 [Blyttiomyces sp. JEL0837]|nr:hypothetical protein HDU76_000560 [Blyttiomyces sp. JEL0837]
MTVFELFFEAILLRVDLLLKLPSEAYEFIASSVIILRSLKTEFQNRNTKFAATELASVMKKLFECETMQAHNENFARRLIY